VVPLATLRREVLAQDLLDLGMAGRRRAQTFVLLAELVGGRGGDQGRESTVII
jgi:hypothetical protein